MTRATHEYTKPHFPKTSSLAHQKPEFDFFSESFSPHFILEFRRVDFDISYFDLGSSHLWQLDNSSNGTLTSFHFRSKGKKKKILNEKNMSVTEGTFVVITRLTSVRISVTI